ncbi:asparagine synthase (glutamine-hydrolysing) [Mucilaginibacter auburnensis]|uniref:asparagine synthase (glutamine-hydrolyzing) n=2 Tax=Mucilaginibacter auburnensis TaxID=1457233 RepID=A0A2H9VM97_9SPHI|nr:asparagine synthase (glutamine-hydrolysing) [Mucilaginibacter auburnensis]
MQRVKAMCHALQHGGPDDEGFFADENGLVFGHRRLAVIDLSQNGHQPMADFSRRVWITFNGEIYNYLELKAELLALGAVFNSNTDTEVIIQSYIYWGTGCFAKLRGIFAFGLYDVQNSRTYLVRDSMGVKPLYYHILNGTLSFASEVKAFKAAGIVTEENPAWRMRFLAFGHVPEPETTLKNVLSLRKGTVLCWDNNKETFNISSYSNNIVSDTINNATDARDAIGAALRTAVKRQLLADAPIGVFLSGGIDSSLLTLLAAEQKHEQLKTVSIFFNDKAYNEAAYQEKVNSLIVGQKHAHLIEQHHFNQHLPGIIESMDMPTTDGINSWFISKYAQQDGLKAVLSGLGADELFGGYPSFKRISLLKSLQQLPSAMLNAAGYLLGDRYKKITYLAHSGPLALYLAMRAIFTSTEVAKLLNVDEKQVNQVLYNADSLPDKMLSDKQLASWLETNLYMQNQLLKDTDVMSMSHGLEVRVPFLDEDFQQVVHSISPHLLFDQHQPKKLLIDSFKDVLPEAIWNRPKMGFSFPLQQWMSAHTQISNEEFYTNGYAKSVIRNFRNNKVHWSKAFTVYLTRLHA